MTIDTSEPADDPVGSIEEARTVRALRTLLALAVERDAAGSDAGGGAGRGGLSFAALAASDGRAPSLPDRAMIGGSHPVEMRVSRGDGALRMELQAFGAQSIRRRRGLRGRLVSDDLAVDYDFQFDARGYSRLLLKDDAATVASLAAGFRIEGQDDLVDDAAPSA